MSPLKRFQLAVVICEATYGSQHSGSLREVVAYYERYELRKVLRQAQKTES